MTRRSSSGLHKGRRGSEWPEAVVRRNLAPADFAVRSHLARAAAGLLLAALVCTALVPVTAGSFGGDTAATASFATAALFGPEWWDPDYDYRQAITVTAGEAAVAGGYAVRLAVDHDALVQAGQALASGDDVRMLHWTGDAWVELDRVLDSGSAWQDAATTLWFATQTPLAAEEADSSYWLYHGNPGAGAALADPDGVYLFHDDFSAGTLARWEQRTPVDVPDEVMPDAAVPDDWYDASWGWRKPVTVDAAQVAGSGAHSDFPVLVSVSDADLRDHARASGGDLLFTAADGTTKLDHEIEGYDATSGELVAWVRVPALSATADTTLYLYYGNPGAADQQNPAGVWDAGYVAVWHLDEDPAGADPQMRDSTTNANHTSTDGASTTITPTPARVGQGLDVPGGADGEYVRRDNTSSLDLTGDQFTLEAWVRADSGGWSADNDAGIITKGTTVNQERYHLGVNGDGSLNVRRYSGGVRVRLDTTAGDIPEGEWVHIAGRYEGSTLKAYRNGVEIGSIAASGNIDASSGGLRLGARHDNRRFSGVFDELRISNVARSADWLATTYNNHSAPDTFASLGAPEPLHVGWYDAGWGWRRAVTVDAARVAGSAVHSDFPVLVSVTDGDLQDGAAADGGDLVFTAADGTTKLDHEIESYDGDSGELVAWVRVPALSATADTTLYLYYGNPGAGDQQNPAGVWTGGYVAVWHLDEDPAGADPQMRDSSANANHVRTDGASTTITSTAARVGRGLDLPGGANAEYVRRDNTSSLDLTGNQFTLEAWVKAGPDGWFADTDVGVISKAHAPDSNVERYHLGVGRWGQVVVRRRSGGQTLIMQSNDADVPEGEWVHVTGRYDGSTLRAYVNGVEVGSPLAASGNTDASTRELRLGARYDSRRFSGAFDELRISNVARSADWLATTYNNHSAPGTFATLGAPEALEVGWYHPSWGWRKPLSVNSSHVVGDHTDFPVLVRTTDADLGDHARPDGADLRFTAADGTTLLYHEIQSFDADTGDVLAWVRVPRLRADLGVQLYLYYGNTDAAAVPAAGTWQAGFEGVYHLDDTPTGAVGDIHDSSPHGRHGTSYAMDATNVATGLTGGALSFSAADETRIDLGNPDGGAWSGLSMSADVYRTGALDWGRVVCRSQVTEPSEHDFCLLVRDDGAVQARVASDTGSAQQATTSTGLVPVGEWRHVAATWTPDDGTIRVYVDGTERATLGLGGSTLPSSSQPVFIGNINATDARYFEGLIDEVRIASVARNVDWILTELGIQASPNEAVSIGAAEGAPASTEGVFTIATDETRSPGYALKVQNADGSDRWISAVGVDGQADVVVDAWWRLSRLEGMDVGQAVRTPAAGDVLHHYEGALRWANDPDRRLEVARFVDGSRTSLDSPAGQPGHAAQTWQRMTVVIRGTGMRVLRDGEQVVPASGWAEVGSDIASGGLGLRASNIDAGEAWWVDDVVARPYVDPEPASTAGSQQVRP